MFALSPSITQDVATTTVAFGAWEDIYFALFFVGLFFFASLITAWFAMSNPRIGYVFAGFFASIAVFFLIVGFMKSDDLSIGETGWKVREDFGISWDRSKGMDFSVDDEQVVSYVENVETVDGTVYSRGALVSRNGEVAVYVYDGESTTPMTLELLSSIEKERFPQP